jgi:hypothetical protein
MLSLAPKGLRYKDYQLSARPAPVDAQTYPRNVYGKLFEVATVKEFSNQMDKCGILLWWKKAMGYS